MYLLAAFIAVAVATDFPATCPPAPSQLRGNLTTIGICLGDFDIIGPGLEAVHEGSRATTGLAVDPDLNIFFTYARNSEKQKYTLTKATNFTAEIPWPSEEWQNCNAGQNASECFVNVQNVVLDAVGQFWVIDSGVPSGASFPLPDGPKIMSFNYTTGDLIRTYLIPQEQYFAKLQLNDIRINNTLGYAFVTDDTSFGSITTIKLDDGTVSRRLFNSTFTRPDPNFTSMYNGEPIRNWNGTTPSFMNSGSNGIALASGNVYWGVKSSHRYYFVSQEALVNQSDEELVEAVQTPGNLPSETAGFTADDYGRVYSMASEHNAILYIDTQDEVLVHKTLIRSGLVQAADTAAIWDGWLYFNTNQQGLSPSRQYKNIDRRRGPFRSYRVWIGRGPAM